MHEISNGEGQPRGLLGERRLRGGGQVWLLPCVGSHRTQRLGLHLECIDGEGPGYKVQILPFREGAEAQIDEGTWPRAYSPLMAEFGPGSLLMVSIQKTVYVNHLKIHSSLFSIETEESKFTLFCFQN